MIDKSLQKEPKREEQERHGQQIVVAFREELDLPHIDAVEAEIQRRRIGPWDKLTEQFPGIAMQRLYRSLTPERVEHMNRVAMERNKYYRPYNFFRVFVIDCPVGIDATALATELRKWPAVEQAYIAPRFVPAAVDNPGSNSNYPNQGYLKPAPEGVDVAYAWQHIGGDGQFVRGADIETWYDTDHEDLRDQLIEVFEGLGPAWWADWGRINHGTKTVGVICASDNNIGVIGITPNIEKFFFVPIQSGLYLADTILSAALSIPNLSVLLIEAQGIDIGLDELPVEVDPQVRQAIYQVTQMGIVIIEPAGNEGVGLDAYIDTQTNQGHVLDRNSTDFFDSGAIMVGACTAGVPHTRASSQTSSAWGKGGSNFGSRVDCYAWGESVYTTCYSTPTNPPKYCNYAGTSSASAIIAGAALSIQGIARRRPSGSLYPLTLRSYFSSSSHGTPVYWLYTSSPPIGYMPDLKRIVDSLVKGGASINLLTPTVHFIGGTYVGQIVYQAVSFEVDSVPQIHLGIKPGAGPQPPFAKPGYDPYSTYELGPTYGPHRVEFWFSFITPAELGDVPPQTVTFTCPETGQEFNVQLTATVKEIPYVAFLLALDKSGSMNGSAGDTGLTKIEALRQALSAFMSLVPTAYASYGYGGNYLGIVSFGAEAWPEKDLTYFDEAGSATQEMLSFAQGFEALSSGPLSKTAIGKALQSATAMLDEASLNPNFNYTKSIVVLTDGRQNVQPYIEDVIDNVNYRTYAIGLGSEQQVNTKALTQLTQSVGGYALLTGELTQDTDDYFRLTKYFIQILLDLTGQEISSDPAGRILPEQLIRIPFTLSDADVRAEVVLLMDHPVIGFELEAPDGTVIDASTPGVSYGNGPKVRFCRMGLPVQMLQGIAHVGIWHARLRIQEINGSVFLVNINDTQRRAAETTGVRYSLSVHTTSSLRLNARLYQASFLPGAPFRLRATPKESGVPMETPPELKAQIRRPDGTSTTIELYQDEPGVFDAEVPTPVPGVYQVRLSASGRTKAGHSFNREKLLTAAVWPGGEDSSPSGNWQASKAVIRARQPWNETGIWLEAGKIYQFTATGKWTDGLITTNADGYLLWPLILFEGFRRAPEFDWFTLIGTIGRTESTRFLIGSGTQYSPAQTGYLYCFANNARWFYWNNIGEINLEVKEV